MTGRTLQGHFLWDTEAGFKSLFASDSKTEFKSDFCETPIQGFKNHFLWNAVTGIQEPFLVRNRYRDSRAMSWETLIQANTGTLDTCFVKHRFKNLFTKPNKMQEPFFCKAPKSASRAVTCKTPKQASITLSCKSPMRRCLLKVLRQITAV